MSDFRNRPNGNYPINADWEALYILTKHWKSDLLFYKDDLNFLNNLIDKYLIWISNEKNSESVRKINNGIIETAKECNDLLQGVDKHLTDLAKLIEDPFKYDTQKFRTEHQQLEGDITNFIKTFRTNRKEVFEVTTHIIESEDFIRIVMEH